MTTCPWCGAKAIDMTTYDDARKRFLCSNGEHEWFEGDEAEVEEPQKPNILQRIVSKIL